MPGFFVFLPNSDYPSVYKTDSCGFKSRRARGSSPQRGREQRGRAVGSSVLCATRSSETDAVRQRGMEGKGQATEDSHGLSVAKNLDNCASIQVR
jgi:hypothetical protein